MLKSLDYSVTFPTTGRTLANQLSFEKGFTAVTGPNESGKSVILEMIRFCLFGTAALRGESADYKTLKAKLAFNVRDTVYEVKRTIGSAKLFRSGVEIVNGVRPVNGKIVELLGFGMTVFDVACAANQGDIEKLGSMRPTERKQMVDSVIGLQVIDDMADWCGKEALGIARLIEGLDKNLILPVAPVQPADYRPSIELTDSVAELKVLAGERQRLDGWLAIDKTEPQAPVETVKRSTQELQEALALAGRYNQAKEALDRLPAKPTLDPDASEASFEAWDLWEARTAFLRNHPRSMTQAEVDQGKADYDLWQAFRGWDLAEEALQSVLNNTGHHCCPACKHEWPVEQAQIAKLTDRAAAAKAFVAGKPRPDEPNLQAIALGEAQLKAWEKDAGKWERLKDAPEAPEPTVTRREIAAARAALAAQAHRPVLEGIVAELGPNVENMQNLNRLLHDRITYEAATKRYEKDADDYAEWKAEHATKLARRDELVVLTAELPALEGQLQAAVVYEAHLQRFEADMAAYLVRKAQIEQHAAEEDGYRRGKEALVLLRKLVKQHLIPSLNKVASHLIKQMTGGARQTIEVTDDFDIKVDGQPLGTLSGSGKAVANLSLRLGLGQVLTNGQFSVFLGDEIDASMDKDRAENTALTLEYMKEKVSQILLVTHKYPPADYYIELGKTDEQTD